MPRSNQHISTRIVGAFVMAVSLLLSGQNLLWAGSFNVSPTRVELSTQQARAALTIQNNGTEAVVIQAQTAAWLQENGQDQYLANADLLATPPIFTIEPGDTQIVRIGMRRAISSDQELSYRLFLQEVSPPPKPGFLGLQVGLRISIPIFIEPKVKADPILDWKVQQQADNRIKVSLTNGGNAHIQVIDFSISSSDREQALAVQQVSAYLLPGQSRMWVLPTDSARPFSGDKVRLMANTDIGKISIDAALEKP